LKAVSGKRMCKILERHGWKLDRISGSHHVYKKAGHRNAISVPVHGNQPLKTGLQHGIMKEAGLTEDDL
jgi:predicted RNA binding protein YcfA (HicA-like mRNA interferase family)